MVHTTLGPDEAIYLAQAKAFRAGRFAALRDIGAEFVDEPTLKSFPSPLRWLWTVLVGLTLPVSPIALQVTAAALLGPTAWLLTHSWQAAVWSAASPLALTLCRRKLQDVPVALVTLLAIVAGLHHSPIGVGAALFVALSLKESSLLAVPAIGAAWVFSGGAPLPLLVALAAGGAAWALALFALFGRNLPAMLRTATSGHATKYAAEHQSGAPHRLLVDLVIVSPAAVLMSVLGAALNPALALALVALLIAHAAAPIRNVRFVLAADVLLRVLGAAAMAHPFIELPIVLAVDAYIAWRIRHVYDPVTQALAMTLGMPNSSAR
jgi:hypothetical protein